MLDPDRTLEVVKKFHEQGREVYLYTALFDYKIINLLPYLKGVHFTIHEGANLTEIDDFQKLQNVFIDFPTPSYRLYINPSVDREIIIKPSIWSRVEIKSWIEEDSCELPNGEELFSLED